MSHQKFEIQRASDIMDVLNEPAQIELCENIASIVNLSYLKGNKGMFMVTPVRITKKVVMTLVELDRVILAYNQEDPLEPQGCVMVNVDYDIKNRMANFEMLSVL
jgi:hypothetical protein